MIKKGIIITLLIAFIIVFNEIDIRPENHTISTISSTEVSADTNSTTIMFTGDIMLGRTVMADVLDKNEPSYPFYKIADTLKSADVVFSNLESPIIDNCPWHTSGYKFCADPKMVEGLQSAGIDIVNLANNHSKDYGEEGLLQTKRHLDQANIKATGLNNLITIKSKDTTFGFLGFDKSSQFSPQLTNDEKMLVKKSDSEVDVLIIAMHWGIEYEDKALPEVRTLARQLVSLGADVVVGHHPHWVQNWEVINDKPVYYSLGNFVFDMLYMKGIEESRRGEIVKLTFDKGKIIRQEFIPTYMREFAQPEITSNK